MYALGIEFKELKKIHIFLLIAKGDTGGAERDEPITYQIQKGVFRWEIRKLSVDYLNIVF